jgi:TM2 domain-containing membrane protein YozV
MAKQENPVVKVDMAASLGQAAASFGKAALLGKASASLGLQGPAGPQGTFSMANPLLAPSENVQAAVEENKKKREANRQRNAAIDAEIKQFPNPSTDRDWRMQDRDPSTLRLLSIFGGLLGLDHFYLRSFKTGFLKLLSTFILPGVWWLWDICETTGYGKRLSVRGMRSPFSWFTDIGRGTIASATADATAAAATAAPAFEPAKKSILVYMFLTLFLGFLGAHRVYAGGGFRSWGLHMVGMLALAMPYFFDVYTALFNQRDIMLRGVPHLFSPDRDGDETTFLPISREQADRQDDQQAAERAESNNRPLLRSLAALAAPSASALAATTSSGAGARATATGALGSLLQSRLPAAPVAPTAATMQSYRAPQAASLLSSTRRSPAVAAAVAATAQTGGGYCPTCVDSQNDMAPYIVLGVLAMVPLVALVRRSWVRSTKPVKAKEPIAANSNTANVANHVKAI